MIEIAKLVEQFDLRADFVSAEPYGTGHINDTYRIEVDQSGLRIRYILQRLNNNVFKQPILLMDNIKRVTDEAIRALKKEGCKECYRRTLSLIPSLEGKPYVQDEEASVWRLYPYIERARTYDKITSTQQCLEIARAFGKFQKMTAKLGEQELYSVIPDFHNTSKRFKMFQAARLADPLARAKGVQKEIDWFLSHEEEYHIISNYLESGQLPQRVTHNDTKLNNVLLDDITGEHICVIDLDTTMLGSSLYDFGDMVRAATSPAAEDEKDRSLITMRMDYFEALVKGYTEEAKFLTSLEKSLLAFSGKLITMECGMRFLTDYLEGDIYFKIKRPDHNLDRCRAQITLAESIEDQMEEMKQLVARYLS